MVFHFFFFFYKWLCVFILFWATVGASTLEHRINIPKKPTDSSEPQYCTGFWLVCFVGLAGSGCVYQKPGCYILERAKEIKTQSSRVQNQLWMAGIHSALRGCSHATGEQAASAAHQRKPSPWKPDWWAPVRQWIVTLDRFLSGPAGNQDREEWLWLVLFCMSFWHESFWHFLLNMD